VEEQTVAAEPLRESLHGARGNVHLAGDLADSGAGDEAHEQRLEEIGAPEPVVGSIGL
jgi:hypothetical protein